MAGEIVHIELRSADFVRSADFYAKLFGWRTDGVQAGGHLAFEPPGGVQGSWIRTALVQAPGPVPFVAVEDLDATLADVEQQGGRVLVRRMTLPGRGHFGLFADPDGNVVGVLAGRAPQSAGGGGAPASTSAPAAKSGKPAKRDAAAEAAPKAPAAKRAPARKPAARKR
jgi:predicted enzyme related to lactoylglutathione lyase